MSGALPAGLTRAEAEARLRADGPNEIARDRPRALLATAWHVLREPMLLLLLAAGGVYLLLGDRREALTLLFFVVAIIGITLVQERKTERALAALRDLTSPRALVVREGERLRVPGREVVVGDLLVVVEGDRVPADALLVDAAHLEVDESLLTGEAVPVRKRPVREGASHAGGPDPRPGGDDLPFLWAGTLVVRGRGLARVRATGPRSETGRIGTALATLESGPTPLQEEVARVVRLVATGGLVLCAAVVVIHGIARGRWLEGALAGLALAMAMLPEEFPVVLTIFMAMGAWRISRSRVLTRRLHAVEALGAATVLLTDKTGTLTENRMRVARLWAPGTMHAVGDGPLPGAVRPLLELGILACPRDPFDPMEQAFLRLGAEVMPEAGPGAGWELERAYPLSSGLLAVSHVWRAPDGRRQVAAKGAPEAIADLCRLDAASRSEVEARLQGMAADGLRVLAVASGHAGDGPLPDGQDGLALALAGLVGLEDPVRRGVPEAVAECGAAGVRVVMVTGDAPETARAVARRVGLPGGEVLTGAELDRLPSDGLAARLEGVRVFARTVPEQKLRLVTALRARGEVVAMTGDGVNDAPALKAAHIGVAMGGRGTDVAREAASLVVTDDDFTSIVAAIRLGRRIHENLRRAMAYVVAVHVPIAGLSLLPLLAGWPLVLFPVHIVFLELVIDPACSLAFEAEPGDPDLMRRPPRSIGARMFDRRLVLLSLLQGVTVLAATLVAFWLGLRHGGEADSARAMAFTTLVAGNVALILQNRSWGRGTLRALFTRNAASWAVVAGATAALLLALGVPFVRELFRLDVAHRHDLAVAAALGLGSLLWFEVVKVLRPAWLGGRPGATRPPRAPA